VLGLTGAVLILASMAGQLFRFATGHDTVWGIIPLFYLDTENNIPSYFSAAQLLIAALLVGAVVVIKLRTQAPNCTRWTLLAFTFLYLSIDEAAGLHELMIAPMRRLLGPWARGALYYAWVVPGAAAAVVLGLVYLKLLREFPDRLRRLVVVGAVLFTGGAIGMELVGGWWFDRYGDTPVYSLIVTVEEGAEMAGITVFIYALLAYLGEITGELRLTFGRA
jgi:hypothetical protein